MGGHYSAFHNKLSGSRIAKTAAATMGVVMFASVFITTDASFFDSYGSGSTPSQGQGGLNQPGSIWTIGTPQSGGTLQSGGVAFGATTTPNPNEPVFHSNNPSSVFNRGNQYFPGQPTNGWFWNGGAGIPAGTNIPAGPNSAPPAAGSVSSNGSIFGNPSVDGRGINPAVGSQTPTNGSFFGGTGSTNTAPSGTGGLLFGNPSVDNRPITPGQPATNNGNYGSIFGNNPSAQPNVPPSGPAAGGAASNGGSFFGNYRTTGSLYFNNPAYNIPNTAPQSGSVGSGGGSFFNNPGTTASGYFNNPYYYGNGQANAPALNPPGSGGSAFFQPCLPGSLCPWGPSTNVGVGGTANSGSFFNRPSTGTTNSGGSSGTACSNGNGTISIAGRQVDRATLNRMIDSGEIYTYLRYLNAEQRQRALESGVIDLNGQVDRVRVNQIFDEIEATNGCVSANGAGTLSLRAAAPEVATISSSGSSGSFFSNVSSVSSVSSEQDLNTRTLLRSSNESSALSTFGAAGIAALATSSDLDIVAFGDSVVRGVGTTDGNDFVSRLEGRIGADIVNAGQSGLTTSQALAQTDSIISTHDPDVVILFIGGNDILQNVPQSVMFSNIAQIIEKFQASGATVILMGIHGSIFRIDFETGFQQVAAQTGALYVPNVLQGILGVSAYLSDAIHPNDEGHRIIADRVEPTLNAAVQIELGQNGGNNGNLQVTCAATPQNAPVGTTVRFRAQASGGSGTYSYAWTGVNSVSASFNEASAVYTTPGTKTAQVTVTSGSATASAPCTVSITAVPLVGSCAVSVTDTGSQTRIRWSAFAAGGNGTYSYSWSGSDGLNVASSTFSSVEQNYSTSGAKTANVTISSAGQSITLNCGADIPAPTATSTEPMNGSCVVSGPLAINQELRWAATPANAGTHSFQWSGTDGLSGSDFSVRRTYSTVGDKSGSVRIRNNATGEEMRLTCEASIATTAPGGGNFGFGCFIATAAFGTPLEERIDTLRKFRDEELVGKPLGGRLVKAYYAVSPPIADFIAEHESLKTAVRTALRPIIYVAGATLE